MKKIIGLLLVLMLIPTFVLSQSELNGINGWKAERARLFKTYTTYTATSDDTTGYVTVSCPGIGSDPLLAREVRLIWVSTDSVAADVYVVARNSFLTAFTSTYADSAVTTTNAGANGVITIRAHGVDRVAGATQFKLGTVFRSTGQGTTAGRTLKWYIEYVR